MTLKKVEDTATSIWFLFETHWGPLLAVAWAKSRQYGFAFRLFILLSPKTVCVFLKVKNNKS